MFFIILMVVLINGRNAICRWGAGWDKLERHFPCGKPEYIGLVSKGSYLGVMGSVAFVPIHFNVEVCREFLWLRPVALGMKGVSISWMDIEHIRLAKSFFQSDVVITLKEMNVPLRISGRAAALAFDTWNKKRSTAMTTGSPNTSGIAAVRP